jgi:hypothetical protein
MASPEDAGKLRGREGRPRREGDAPPVQKRLRLGLEGGSADTEDGDAAPRGGEDTGAGTGGEDGEVSGRGRSGGRGPGALATDARPSRVKLTIVRNSSEWALCVGFIREVGDPVRRWVRPGGWHAPSCLCDIDVLITPPCGWPGETRWTLRTLRGWGCPRAPLPKGKMVGLL